MRESEVDHIIERIPLKAISSHSWELRGGWWRSSADVIGQGLNARLVMDASISDALQGRYTFQLRDPSGVILRRLDVRATHSNPAASGSSETWKHRTHKHRWSDAYNDAIAYTPTDIPPTTSPPHLPEPREHSAVYAAFCNECGVDPADSWVDPPL